MKYIFTDFYNEFECVGGTCPDTCCGKWKIPIDDDTMQKYAGLEEPQKKWLYSGIKEEIVGGKVQNVIKMKENGYCPFLNEGNLCDIYLKVAPDALSYVCQTYPRKIITYYDVVFATVCVSCPEVVRILLRRKEPITFEYVEDNGTTNIAGADWILYNEMINGLVITTDILQKRTYTVWERVYLVLDITYQIQKHINEGNLVNLRKDIELYKAIDFCDEKVGKIRNAKGYISGYWAVIHDILNWLERIDNMSEESRTFFQRYICLEKTDEKTYCNWLKSFKEIEEETEFENLAVDFIFEYYMDTLKGKNLFTNVIKMVLLLVMIRSYEVLHYNVTGELAEEVKIEIISKLSRIMEHTQVLNKIVEELLKNNREEELYKLAYLLF